MISNDFYVFFMVKKNCHDYNHNILMRTISMTWIIKNDFLAQDKNHVSLIFLSTSIKEDDDDDKKKL